MKANGPVKGPVKHLSAKRSGEVEGGTLALVVVLVVLVLALGFGALQFGVTPAKSQNTTNGVTNCASINPAVTTQQDKFTASAFSGDSALTSPTANVFGPQTSWANLGADNPGSLSSSFTSGGSYSPTAGLVAQITATGAYPIWAPLNGQTFQQGGINVLTSLSTSGSVAGTCVTLYGSTPIQAPGSGTSATTNVAANVISAAGTALTTAANKMPSTATEWITNLNIKQAYKGAGYAECVYSVQSATVVNYATGATLPAGACQTFQTVEIVSLNRTNYILGLDQSSSGLTMQQITNPGATVSSLNYVISGFTGCAPASSSVSTYNCLTSNIDIYQTDTGKTGHTAVTTIWADMQEPAFVISHFTNPALTAYPASGAAAGLPTSFAFVVPTTAPDGGAPTVLIEQSFTAIQLQN